MRNRNIEANQKQQQKQLRTTATTKKLEPQRVSTLSSSFLYDSDKNSAKLLSLCVSHRDTNTWKQQKKRSDSVNKGKAMLKYPYISHQWNQGQRREAEPSIWAKEGFRFDNLKESKKVKKQRPKLTGGGGGLAD